MTAQLILAFIIAFLVSSLVGHYLVPFLRRIKAGQAIREDGPRWHMNKSGTPTMGGLMFIAAVTIVCLTVGFPSMLEGDYGRWARRCCSSCSCARWATRRPASTSPSGT